MIIDQIVDRTQLRIAQEKKKRKIAEVRLRAEEMPRGDFPVEQILRQKDLTFICEVKKASPSTGVIAPYFPYVKMAQEYAQAGAALMSVWTEPYFFLGSAEYLKEIVAKVPVPAIAKDFVIDPYQIYEAKCMGASGIFLMSSVLTDSRLMEFIQLAVQLGLTPLVEVYTEEEVSRALKANAQVLVINNRNQETFQVDVRRSVNFSAELPDQVLRISEGGIQTREHVQLLKKCGMDGILISELLMRSQDRMNIIRRLNGEEGNRLAQ